VVAVVGTVQERHNLAVVEERHIGPEAELHTGPEVDRHTGSAAAHHIDLAEVAGRSLAEAGSHRTVDFALVAVDGNLVVEVVDIVAAGRILEGAGLGPDMAADNRLAGCDCRTCSAVIPAEWCSNKR
jgi:hypothetical protein